MTRAAARDWHAGDMSDDDQVSGTRRSRIWRAADSAGVPLRAILVTVAIVVLVYLAAKLVVRLRDVLLLFVVAGFIALLLNPLVIALQGVFKRRGIAVAVVTLLAVLAFGGLATAFGLPLVNGITHLAEDLPSYVTKAEHGNRGGWIGRIVMKYHLQAWIHKNAPKLASYGRDLAKPALSLGEGAVSLMFSLFTIFILVILLMLEGPKLRSGVLGLMSESRARRYSEVAREVNRSVTGYMLGDFTTSVIAGAVVLVTLLSLGVPFPYLCALWVALVDFLPMIGGALAGIPVVLLATTQGVPAGIITLVVFLVYTQIENHVLNPVVMSRTVRINPLIVLVSILVGASIGSWVGGIFGGFVAALLSIPAAGALQVIVREVWLSTGSAPAAQQVDDVQPAAEAGSAEPGAQEPAGTAVAPLPSPNNEEPPGAAFAAPEPEPVVVRSKPGD
jgi:predicted PurR-regulated permease PerM